MLHLAVVEQNSNRPNQAHPPLARQQTEEREVGKEGDGRGGGETPNTSAHQIKTKRARFMVDDGAP
jgi:hypothetical protein